MEEDEPQQYYTQLKVVNSETEKYPSYKEILLGTKEFNGTSCCGKIPCNFICCCDFVNDSVYFKWISILLLAIIYILVFELGGIGFSTIGLIPDVSDRISVCTDAAVMQQLSSHIADANTLVLFVLFDCFIFLPFLLCNSGPRKAILLILVWIPFSFLAWAFLWYSSVSRIICVVQLDSNFFYPNSTQNSTHPSQNFTSEIITSSIPSSSPLFQIALPYQQKLVQFEDFFQQNPSQDLFYRFSLSYEYLQAEFKTSALQAMKGWYYYQNSLTILLLIVCLIPIFNLLLECISKKRVVLNELDRRIASHRKYVLHLMTHYVQISQPQPSTVVELQPTTVKQTMTIETQQEESSDEEEEQEEEKKNISAVSKQHWNTMKHKFGKEFQSLWKKAKSQSFLEPVYISQRMCSALAISTVASTLVLLATSLFLFFFCSKIAPIATLFFCSVETQEAAFLACEVQVNQFSQLFTIPMYISFSVAIALTAICNIILILLYLQAYQRDILAIRRGTSRYNLKKVNMINASSYIGIQGAHVTFGTFLNFILFTIIGFIIFGIITVLITAAVVFQQQFWDSVKWFLEQMFTNQDWINTELLIIVRTVPLLLTWIIAKLLNDWLYPWIYLSFEKKLVKEPYMYSFFEACTIIYSMFLGIFKAVMVSIFFKVIIDVLLYAQLFRPHNPNFGYYLAMLKMDSAHFNPILNTFCHELVDLYRKDKRESKEAGMTTPLLESNKTEHTNTKQKLLTLISLNNHRT